MLQRSLWISCLLLILCTTLVAQEKRAERYYQKAEKALAERNWEKGQKFFLKAAEADPNWAIPFQQLGVMAYRGGKDSLSIQYLEAALNRPLDQDVRIHHMLSELYLRNRSFKKALYHAENFVEKGGDYPGLQKEARNWMKRCQKLIRMKEDPDAFDLYALPATVNTEAQEYLPVLPADQRYLLFTRRFKPDGSRYMEEDYFVSNRSDTTWGKALPLKSINTREPEGGASLSADGKTLFLVRCEERKGVGGCDLYVSFLRNGTWSEAVNLGSKINTPYNEKQPSLSADGSRLYFASNRPGGMGGMDIWYIDWEANSGWSEAQVLDSNINSSYHEKAPFIHYDNQTLYFTSDRPESLGESDIFLSRKKGSRWMPAEHVGWPVSSPGEEGTIYVTIDGVTAYMGKIAEGRKDYDIYRFQLKEKVAAIPSNYIHGRVVDAISGQPLEAQIEVLEKQSGDTLSQMLTNDQGEFLFAIPINREYQFFADVEGYRYYSRQFNYEDLEKTEEGVYVQLELHPLEKLAMDTQAFVLENIYFETGSARLKEASEAELQRLFQLLKKEEFIDIELRGHTDDVGSAQANQILSMQRAKAVYDHLINKGISEDRLNYKGYGETLPLVPNTSPENRRKNRRVEFVVDKNEDEE